MQYNVKDAYENSTFCNKFKLERDMRDRRSNGGEDGGGRGGRASSSFGGARVRHSDWGGEKRGGGEGHWQDISRAFVDSSQVFFWAFGSALQCVAVCCSVLQFVAV